MLQKGYKFAENRPTLLKGFPKQILLASKTAKRALQYLDAKTIDLSRDDERFSLLKKGIRITID